MRFVRLVILMLFVAANFSHASVASDNKEALRQIALESNEICGQYQLSGSSSTASASAGIGVGVDKLVARLVNLKVDGAVKYQQSENKGILQSQALDVIRTSTNCKVDLAKHFGSIMLVNVNSVKNYSRGDKKIPKKVVVVGRVTSEAVQKNNTAIVDEMMEQYIQNYGDVDFDSDTCDQGRLDKMHKAELELNRIYLYSKKNNSKEGVEFAERTRGSSALAFRPCKVE